MSWTPDLIIGELRPWPDAVLVRRGDTDDAMLYTITPLPHFWTGDDTLHVEPRKLPERIDVTLPDERGREVHSARVHRFVPERTCHEIKDEDTGFIICSECGAIHDEYYTSYHCWCCGAKVEVDE